MCHGASLLPLNQIASQLKALRDEQGMRLNQNSQSEMRACLQKITSSLQNVVGNSINKLTEESKDNQEALKNAQSDITNAIQAGKAVSNMQTSGLSESGAHNAQYDLTTATDAKNAVANALQKALAWQKAENTAQPHKPFPPTLRMHCKMRQMQIRT